MVRQAKVVVGAKVLHVSEGMGYGQPSAVGVRVFVHLVDIHQTSTPVTESSLTRTGPFAVFTVM